MAKKKEQEPELIITKGEEKEVKELPKPTPEEVEQYKADFEKSLEDFHATRWDLAESKGAFASQEVAMFLLDYMKRFAMWSKNGWMGMIKMDEEIKAAQKAITDEVPFSLDYQGIEFCAYMLLNPGGIGLQAALDFETIADKYAKVSMTVAKQQEDARKTLREIAWKQERYTAGVQGFYLSELEPEIEHEVEVDGEGEECDDCDQD
jgi:hypothetical protein